MEDINTKAKVLRVKFHDVVSLFLGPDILNIPLF